MYFQSSMIVASLLLTPILSLPTQTHKTSVKRDEVALKPGGGPVYTIDSTIGGTQGQATPGTLDSTQETTTESITEGNPADTPTSPKMRRDFTEAHRLGGGPTYTIDNTITGTQGQATPGTPDTTQETVTESTSEANPANAPTSAKTKRDEGALAPGGGPVYTIPEVNGDSADTLGLSATTPSHEDKQETVTESTSEGNPADNPSSP